MATTRRQVNDALGQLPDNTDNEISPEDLRDAFLSSIGEFIQFHVAPGDLPFAVVLTGNAFEEIDAPAIQTVSDNWQDASPGPGSEYVGTIDIFIFGSVMLSFISAMQNREFEFRLRVNGVVDDGSVMQIATGTNAQGKRAHVAIPVSVAIQPGDEVVLEVADIGGGGNDIDITAFSGYWMSRPQ